MALSLGTKKFLVVIASMYVGTEVTQYIMKPQLSIPSDPSKIQKK
ncbi:hypothetical protein MIR68_009866 [Amoeboaphelidium protococcarum]|nr:hypothetical protein MIR68_009866 [Amoeboaphelidium protococcarum]KAI3648470.1 hypothetical protein MP228_006324 [Amoeboaphelidium protococcarum]